MQLMKFFIGMISIFRKEDAVIKSSAVAVITLDFINLVQLLFVKKSFKQSLVFIIR